MQLYVFEQIVFVACLGEEHFFLPGGKVREVIDLLGGGARQILLCLRAERRLAEKFMPGQSATASDQNILSKRFFVEENGIRFRGVGIESAVKIFFEALNIHCEVLE